MSLSDPALSSAPWYAIQVAHRAEAVVATALRNKGYPEFLPLYRSRRVWSDRIVELDLPLFPGYVFCRFHPHDRRVPIVTTPGVRRIVSFGGAPIPVDEAEIAAVQAILASGLPAAPCPYLAAGRRVRIRHGALQGVEGIVVESKTRHRFVVSVHLLQRSVSVEIDSAWLAPAGPPPLRPRIPDTITNRR